MTRWLSLAAAVAVLALATSLYVCLFAYDRLPARVPTHWNIRGEPDAWMAKRDAVPMFFIMPALMAGLVALAVALPWLSPEGFRVEGFRNTFAYVMFLVIVLQGYIHLCILLATLVPGLDLNRLLFGGLFLFFALVGNVMGKMRRNFWMGVRTPWTLASEGVWNQTHRLTAWLWVAAGLAGLAGVLAGVPPLLCLAGLLVAVLVPVLYSLILYKRLQRAGRL